MTKKDKSSLSTWLKRAVGLAFVAVVVALLVVSWMPKPFPVDVAEVSSGSLEVTVDEDGYTRVKDRYTVSAPLGGNVARIALAPGDTIEEGAIVAHVLPVAAPLMDPRRRAEAQARVSGALAAQRQTRSTISRAEASLELAETEVGRTRGLAQSGAASAQSLDRAEVTRRTRSEELTSARFGARVAAYELQMARAALGRHGSQTTEQEQLEIPSPVGGRVLRVILESEGVVQPGTPLLEVGDPTALEIVVDVLTSDAVHIEPGARVRVERWGGEAALEGHVRLVEPSAFSHVSALGVQERRVNVIIDLDTDSDVWQGLGDGYRVEARIVVWRADDVVRAPSSAAFRHDEGWAVFVVEGELARLTPIEVGRRGGLQVEVQSGLRAGDRVIVHPSDQVSDGLVVAPR